MLPASASDEAGANPDGVAAAIAESVNRDGFYVVSVGGRIGTASTAERAFYTINGGSLAERLTLIVDQVHVFSQDDDQSSWWWIAPAVAGTVFAVGAAAAAWRRRASSRP